MPGREGENVCWAGISLEVPRQSFATFGKSKTVRCITHLGGKLTTFSRALQTFTVLARVLRPT